MKEDASGRVIRRANLTPRIKGSQRVSVPIGVEPARRTTPCGTPGVVAALRDGTRDPAPGLGIPPSVELAVNVTVAYSEGRGSFAPTGDTESGRARGAVESTLTGVYPYLRLRPNRRISLWVLIGAPIRRRSAR